MVGCLNWDHSLLWWPVLYLFFYIYGPVYLSVLSKCNFLSSLVRTEAGQGETASLWTSELFSLCKCAFFSYNFIQSFLKNVWHAIRQILGCPEVFYSYNHTWKMWTLYGTELLFVQYFSICDKSLVQLGPWMILSGYA